MKTVPFVKWAGGKTQLLSEIRKNYPKTLGTQITKYCEPFVGGGAVLFDVLQQYPMKEVLINDVNPELVNTYCQIRDNTEEIINQLEQIQNSYWEMDEEERKAFYYQKRDRFNAIKQSADKTFNIEKAVLFVFLNRTCFNGLFRVNKKGQFNVPIGSYKKPLICDCETLKTAAILLQNVEIQCGDYKNTAGFMDEKTFVYIDPPYRPLNATANFTAYAQTEFGDSQQIELKQFVDLLSAKGAKVLVSNSDPKNYDEKDEFFDLLYRSYKINRVSAKRMINSKASARGNISELLIANFSEEKK